MSRATLVLGFGLAQLAMLAAPSAYGATSFSNSLTGFTGNSTQPATQAALNTAGFNLATTTGAASVPGGNPADIDPTIGFAANGATFGVNFVGDGGRNYLRTNQTDFAFASFTAGITFTTLDIDAQDVYFGLGAGVPVPTFYRLADFDTHRATVQFFGESETANPTLEVSRTRGDGGFVSTFTAIPGLGPTGTHRAQITLDRFARTFTLAFDLDYTGTFAADVTTPAMDISGLYGPTGFQGEPSRIFFGGDDGMVIKDFSVSVTSPVLKDGDFNNDGLISASDWIILRNNQHVNLTGNTQAQAFLLGDLNGDLKNNHADFAYFKQLYDFANGVGSFAAMAASVPEPASGFLLGSALLALVSRGRRAAGR